MARQIFGSTVVRAGLFLLLGLMLVQPAEAQRRRGDIGRGYFQAGFMMLDLDDLNASLSDAGYPALDDRFLTLGGAGYGSRGRLLIGGEGLGILGQEETTTDGSHNLSVNGGMGLFRLGYLAFTDEGFELFPSLGIGGGGMSLKIAERSSPSFDDVLGDPGRSSTLTTGMLLVDASLGLNYRFVTGSDDGRAHGILLGVEGGYTYSPWDSGWDLDGVNDVAGGPELRIEGFHVRVSIGGWNRR